MFLVHKLKNRWQGEGGYREFLTIAFPLILSTGAWSIQHFIDRMFLSWYSPDAIAASMPAGILNFTILSLFIGTASYVNTFVAQYNGAKQFHRIGDSVWQGFYFSFLALVTMLIVMQFAEPIFQLAGHAPEVQELEKQYFQIMCAGGLFPVASAAFSGFFSGRGSTWIVMLVNCTATATNVLFDYLLIFGNFGFPHLGIRGAAIATVLSGFVSFSMFFILMLRPTYQQKFGTWRGRKLDKKLFKRLVHFGFPNGVQFFLEMMAFTMFIFLVGRIGKIELAATNISFNINMLAFMPMLGAGIGISVLVGNRLGENNPKLAEKTVWSASHVTFLYMTSISMLYFFTPDLFLKPFGVQAESESFQQIRDYGVILLRFVAFYSIFDAMNIVFSSSVKGAGDTKFVMKVSIVFSWIVMVVPTFLATIVFNFGLFVAWTFATIYITLISFIFLYRFLGGKWKSMRVIEEVPRLVSVPLSEHPAPDVEI